MAVGISGTSISTGTDGHTSIGGKNSTTASFSTDSSGNTTYTPAGMTATEAAAAQSNGSDGDNSSDYGHDDRGFAFTKDVSNPQNTDTFSQSKSRYNAQGVDENGLTMNGRAGDRNGDGKISFGEALANNLSNVGARMNMAFGGADSFGRTSQGRTADRNGDGRISFGERMANMFSNAGASINQAFGGVNYAGENKSGEHVVAPGQHVSFGQRITNIGHNIASKNGATWNDENNNGIMDKGEVAKAAAGRMATGILGLVPTVGKALANVAQGAMGGKTNGFLGQLGRSINEVAANNNATLNNATPTPTGTTAATQDQQENKRKAEEVAAPALVDNSKNFIRNIKRTHLTLPTTTSVFIKQRDKDNNNMVATVSDEDVKKFALHFYNTKTIKNI